MTVVFSIRPWPRVGFTDQLQQLTSLLKLGRSLGWSYRHVPFSSERSSPTIYDFLGVDRYLQSVYPAPGGMRDGHVDGPAPELSLDDAALQRAGVDSLGTLAAHVRCRARQLLGDAPARESTLVLSLARRSTRRFFRWIHPGIPALPDGLDLREGIRRFGGFVPGESDFAPRPLRILVHIRLGDTACLPTPWGTFVHVKALEGGRRGVFESQSLPDEAFIEPHHYLRFIESLLRVVPRDTASTLVSSDGYSRIVRATLRDAKRLGLTAAKQESLREAGARLEHELFRGFVAAGTSPASIGESDDRLHALIRAALAADVIVFGRRQRMMPKLLAQFADPRRAPRLVALGWQRNPPDYTDLGLDRHGASGVRAVRLSSGYGADMLRHLLHGVAHQGRTGFRAPGRPPSW